MDKEKFELETRLTAIEHLVCDLQNQIYAAANSTEEDIALREKRILDELRRRAFPTLDPVVSDMASDQIVSNLARLLSLSKSLRAQARLDD